MARWRWAGLMMLAGTVPAMAALPPHYQRQAEFIAIVQAGVEAFGIEHPIESIVMKGGDFYEVVGGACRMDMHIVDVPPAPAAEPMAGPRQFAVETGPLACN